MAVVEYTLLELIEVPQRINSIKHNHLFDYILESTENQDRFESFITVLENKFHWAVLGLAMMSSDIVPFKKIFGEAIAEYKDKTISGSGSLTEMSVFNQLYSYFERCYIADKNLTDKFISYIFESCPEDEWQYISTCLNQTFKRELYDCFKLMHEHGKLPKGIAEWFRFSMDTKPLQNNEFSSKFIIASEAVAYFKIGNTLIKDDEIVDQRTSREIIRKVTRFNFPNICVLHVRSELTPYMIVTTEGTFLTEYPQNHTDEQFVQLMHDGYTNFCFVRDNTVISVSSDENKFFTKKSINNVVSVVKIPYNHIVSGVTGVVLLITDKKNKQYIVYAPNSVMNIEFTDVEKVSIIEYQNNLYYRYGE